MRRFWVLVFAAAVVSFAGAQVSVEGELSGFFLTNQGQLIWQTLSGHERIPNLQPLWGHYRLVLTVKSSNKPIKSVEVSNARGQKIWQQNFEPPRTECRIPAYPPSALQIHASDGFAFRVVVTFADGSKLESQWKAPIDRPVHPFRIDWLSVAAMTEALGLLRKYGKELFLKSSNVSLAWCFRGENGQLFVNHPNPPKGSRQVNLPLLSGVSVFWLPEKKRPFFVPGAIRGMTSLIGGKWTCSIDYVPIWANRDPSGFRIDILNATMWVYVALHEALHAVLLSTFNAREEQFATEAFKFVPTDKRVDWLVAQWMEKEALKQALSAVEDEDEEKAKQWTWAFLQFREKRRALYGNNRRLLTRSEQVKEWTENISHWGAVWLLNKAEQERVSPLLASDPTVASYPDEEFDEWANDFSKVAPNNLALELVTSHGLGKLLSFWDKNWLQKAAQGRLPEDLLAEVTGYTVASKEERNTAVDEVASEILVSAVKLREQLREFFEPAKGKPSLSVSGRLPESIELEMDETDGQLKAIVLSWNDGSSLKVFKTGKVAFAKSDRVEVYAPVNKPLQVSRHQNRLLAQIGDFISLNWLPESKTLSVQVLGKRWSISDSRSKPTWLPPEGWTAIQVGQSWLWVKAVIRGGLQFFHEGGKRWGEAPMVVLPNFVPPHFAITPETPSELVFVVRSLDRNLKVNALNLKFHSFTVNSQPVEVEDEVTVQAKSPKGEKEFQLVLPFKLRWQVEHDEKVKKSLVWFVRFGDKEVRWYFTMAPAELRIDLTNGKTAEILLLPAVFHPLLQAIEVRAHQEMPGELLSSATAPVVGARCRAYLYRGEFDLSKAQCIAEGVTDETGKAFLLVPALDAEKFGLNSAVVVEHENMGCRTLGGLGLLMSQDSALFGSVTPVNSWLAPHEVTFTLEIEATRQLYRAEISDGQWREFKEREEPIAKVRVVVERKKKIDAPSQTIFDGEVEGRLTLTIPTLGHAFPERMEDFRRYGQLRVKIIDPVTAKEEVLRFSIDSHGLIYHEYIPGGDEKEQRLVGKNNPPIKVNLVFIHYVSTVWKDSAK